MSKNASLVNIGTEEAPIYIPEKALSPESDEGQEWWQMLAAGSVVISDEEMAALLQYLGQNQ